SVLIISCLFFFSSRRRHTRSDRDWSSDVCSSDLPSYLDVSWIPVDASEAWKHQDKKDYFFGAHDDNRVQFTVGRDIRLDPPQQGAPLNYFIYPYGELDGKPLALASQFTFHDRMNAAGRD